MFVCECGGMLIPIAIEEPPEELSKEEKLIYKRVCDVKCMSCNTTIYAQPYDGKEWRKAARKTKKLSEK